MTTREAEYLTNGPTTRGTTGAIRSAIASVRHMAAGLARTWLEANALACGAPAWTVCPGPAGYFVYARPSAPVSPTAPDRDQA